MNVIWIIADTLRRDAVGAYGNKTIQLEFDSLVTRYEVLSQLGAGQASFKQMNLRRQEKWNTRMKIYAILWRDTLKPLAHLREHLKP